jgi:PAX-interacting protein 1
LFFYKDIRQSGGVVEDLYSTKVTHVLCRHQHGEYYRNALADGKRLITRYWLEDVIFDQKLFAPQTALHLPVPLKDRRFCYGMVSMLAEY